MKGCWECWYLRQSPRWKPTPGISKIQSNESESEITGGDSIVLSKILSLFCMVWLSVHMCLLQKICRITVNRKDHLIRHHYHLKKTIVRILFIFIPIFPSIELFFISLITFEVNWLKLISYNLIKMIFFKGHWSKLHSLYIIPRDILVFILFHKWNFFKKSNQGKGNQDQCLSSKFNGQCGIKQLEIMFLLI